MLTVDLAQKVGNQAILSRHALFSADDCLHAHKLIQFVGPLSVFYEFYNTSGTGRLEFPLVDQTIGRLVRLLV